MMKFDIPLIPLLNCKVHKSIRKVKYHLITKLDFKREGGK